MSIGAISHTRVVCKVCCIWQHNIAASVDIFVGIRCGPSPGLLVTRGLPASPSNSAASASLVAASAFSFSASLLACRNDGTFVQEGREVCRQPLQ